MSFPFDTPATITHRTPNGLDSFKDPVYTKSTETVMGAFAPTGSTEDQAQDTANDQPAFYVPVGTNVSWIDVITIYGDDYQVAGRPGQWADLGIEIRLQAVIGEPAQ